ncbi:MAG: hypothetical protein ACTSVR_01395, partial [Candidatus Thorarchaeota archaeon]
IQGSNSESWQVSKNTSETGSLALSNDISGTDNHFNLWIQSNLSYYYTSVKVQLISTAGNYREYTLATAASPEVSGDFKCFALDIAGGTETGTFIPASFSQCDITVDNSSSGNIRSVVNNWIDAMYYGSGLTFDGSSDTNDTMFTEATALDEATAQRYGVLQTFNEQIFCQGNLVFDDNGSANTQKSTGENIVFTKKDNATNAYSLDLIGSNNTVVFTNTNISATDTARFTFDSSGTVGSFTMTGGGMKKASEVDFKTGQTIDGVSFTECGEVDPNGATIQNCKFINTIETTTGALIVNTEAEGEACDDLRFTGYSASSNYAVYVASGVTEFDMDNWYFDDPNNTTDYAVYWAGTGGTLTINALNGTNLVSAGCTSAGGTVSVVANPVTTTITVKDISTDTEISGAQTLVYVADDTNYPYQDSVTITRSVSTATVAHTGHGLASGDNVLIEGAVQDEYNGAFQITVTGVDAYTYTVQGTPTTPATGTILSTFCLIDTTTNGSGQASKTKTFASNQPITGWVRKASSSPFYKTAAIAGTVSSSAGLDLTIQMVRD